MGKFSLEHLRGVACALPEADAQVVEAAASRLEALQRAFDADAQKDAQLQEIGESAAASIAEMVAALEVDYELLAELRKQRDDGTEATMSDDERAELAALESEVGDCKDQEDARQRIEEDALSVEVRSDWHTPHADREPPAEYCILLSTGGPATRIVGELNEHGEPSSARLQAQDWGTPWTDYRGDAVSEDALLTYARCFQFWEGR